MHKDFDRFTKLLHGGAQQRHYTLPEPVTDAYKAALRGHQAADEAPGHGDRAHVTTRRKLIADTTAAIRDGGELPDLVAGHKALLDAEQHEQAITEARGLLEKAADQLTAHADSAVHTHSQRIITDHLRPALDEVYAEAHALTEQHGPKLLSGEAETAMRTGEAAAAAWLRIEELARRQQSIIAMHRELSRRGVRSDTDNGGDGWFRLMRLDPRDKLLFGDNWSRHAAINGKVPWPQDHRGFLVWLVSTPELELWLPTAAERDERHREVFPPKKPLRPGEASVSKMVSADAA